ncbi:MAG: hypothetical protein AAF387_12580, partial [Pseudomonadota bacterium]
MVPIQSDLVPTQKISQLVRTVHERPPEMYIGGGELATPEDLYAQRYESGVTQVSEGNKTRFV